MLAGWHTPGLSTVKPPMFACAATFCVWSVTAAHGGLVRRAHSLTDMTGSRAPSPNLKHSSRQFPGCVTSTGRPLAVRTHADLGRASKRYCRREPTNGMRCGATQSFWGASGHLLLEKRDSSSPGLPWQPACGLALRFRRR